MALDIIKEQRMIRTIFYSLIQSADLLVDNKAHCEQFVSKVGKFISEKTLREEDTRDVKEASRELLETLGWKSIGMDINLERGNGNINLGKNRFIVNEIADSKGALLVIQALFEGIGSYIFKSPVSAKVELSLSSSSYYNITLTRKKIQADTVLDKPSAVPFEVADRSIHETLTIDSMFNPIFTKDVPSVILFETIWKVVTESYVANVTDESDFVKEALKNPTMENLSLIIMKLTENEEENEILNMSEILGEFVVKILSTKISGSLISRLQTTLRDRHAINYLIYYECRLFCADKKFVNRCTFIRGMWVGLLSEIFSIPIKIKELYHAGKRDRYCMLELVPKKST
ncbi:MAG: hypothetical protein HZR80_13405 [Candidatus Heimdallarchaeota archaeon]